MAGASVRIVGPVLTLCWDFGDNVFPCLGHDGATRGRTQELGDLLQRLDFVCNLTRFADNPIATHPLGLVGRCFVQ